MDGRQQCLTVRECTERAVEADPGCKLWSLQEEISCGRALLLLSLILICIIDLPVDKCEDEGLT